MDRIEAKQVRFESHQPHSTPDVKGRTKAEYRHQYATDPLFREKIDAIRDQRKSHDKELLHILASDRYFYDPDYREKLRQQSKLRYQNDPDYREKTKERSRKRAQQLREAKGLPPKCTSTSELLLPDAISCTEQSATVDGDSVLLAESS